MTRLWLAILALAVTGVPLGAQTGPTARSCHAMVPTPDGKVAFMLGGSDFCGRTLVRDSALWRWDGTWAPTGTYFPGIREDVQLAYDGRHGRVVLYGGRNGDTVYADTWEWDGQAFQRRAGERDGGPGPVEHGAIAFDQRRGRAVLFGGASRTDRRARATLWEWDGARWAERAQPGPAARVGHTMTWSATEQAVLLYGGFNDSGSLRDLWKWDGTRWTQLDAAGPTYTEGSALLEGDSVLYLVGTGLTTDSPWQHPLQVWRRGHTGWEQISRGAGPPGRVAGAVAWVRKGILLFGGATPGPTGETWFFQEGAWTRR